MSALRASREGFAHFRAFNTRHQENTMRKLLERYLETKRLFDQTTEAFEDELDEDLRKAAVEIAEGELRLAREQLAGAIQENGLPSVEAKLSTGEAGEPYRKNEALAMRWLQEQADKQKRAQFLSWRQGQILRASPKREVSAGFVVLGGPDLSNPMKGM